MTQLELLTDRELAVLLTMRNEPLTTVEDVAGVLGEGEFIARAELNQLARQNRGLVYRDSVRIGAGLTFTYRLSPRGEEVVQRINPGPVYTPDVDGRCVHCERPYTRHPGGRCSP